MKRLVPRAAAVCSSLLLACSILAACTTVPIQTDQGAADVTITWVVTQVGAPGPHILSANSTLNIQAGVQYDVSMHANSPSGVKSLAVNGGDDWGCLSGDTGKSGGDSFAPQTVSQTAKNGQAQDELFSFQTVSFPQSPCQDGFTFTGGGIGFDGTATNFANQQSTGHLALTVAP